MKLIKLTTEKEINEFFSCPEAVQGVLKDNKDGIAVLLEEDSKVVISAEEKLFPLAGDVLILSEGKIYSSTPNNDVKKEIETEIKNGYTPESESVVKSESEV